MGERLDFSKAKSSIANISKQTLEILKKYGAFLCGGAVLSTIYDFPINDYDLYFECEEDRHNCYLALLSIGADITWNSENAISLSCEGKKFQLVGSFYGSRIDILNSFDFNICQIGLCLAEENIVTVEDYPSFHYPEVKLNPKYNRKLDLRRIDKYKSRGFSFDENSTKNYTDRKLENYYQ
jgi:hypothetical protein